MTTSTTTASPQHCCTGCDRFPEEWTLQAHGLGLCENDIDDSVLMKRSHTDPNCWEGMGVFSCGDAYSTDVLDNIEWWYAEFEAQGKRYRQLFVLSTGLQDPPVP